MIAAYADFFHYYGRVAVPTDRYLLLAKSNQKYRKSFILRLNLLKDRIWWIRSIVKVQQHVLPPFVGKLRLVIFLTNLTLGLFVREEKCIVVLSLLNLVVNPIF